MNTGQRRFAIMGENTFKITNKIIKNQRICRLLKYQNRNPFDKDLPDVDGLELLNKQILIIPKFYDVSNEKMSYIVTVFEDFSVSAMNPDFKLSTIRFDIACPYDECYLDDTNFRPYLIMQEIDSMFNQAKLSGIGNLQFQRARPLTLSPQLGGYSMEYSIYEFN